LREEDMMKMLVFQSEQYSLYACESDAVIVFFGETQNGPAAQA